MPGEHTTYSILQRTVTTMINLFSYDEYGLIADNQTELKVDSMSAIDDIICGMTIVSAEPIDYPSTSGVDLILEKDGDYFDLTLCDDYVIDDGFHVAFGRIPHEVVKAAMKRGKLKRKHDDDDVVGKRSPLERIADVLEQAFAEEDERQYSMRTSLHLMCHSLDDISESITR